MGCPTRGKNRKEIVQCLTEVPPDDIVNKEVGVASPSLNYSPFVITNDYNRFITKQPTEIIMEKLERIGSGDGSVMIGMNQDEGSKALMYYLPRMFPNQELEIKVLSKQMFDAAITKIFHESKSKEVSISQRYNMIGNQALIFNKYMFVKRGRTYLYYA